MVNYKVDVSTPAQSDLSDIIRYISAQLTSSVSAVHLMEIFEEALMSLSDLPQRYPLIDDELLSQLGYRKMIVKNYVVFFSIDEANKVVNVERILYGRRDWFRFL
ncbi:MAG: type II toxin-antitoxin system RelE/ParE family toxin [Firmicutes bacterium HGW-Firmicutes-20]|jgi:toxin ParE1/3/4|nr:MAG: type II toxin-antitoxin system RelE/ParE family toxin [Firmicutes bacterium HGW-Firmicutes-20]PKM65092.1 MAG: type II toxin-antitoxin system RelE/ParE family toxin [Firmicutes bacterium HGW-Firmicutes-19]